MIKNLLFGLAGTVMLMTLLPANAETRENEISESNPAVTASEVFERMPTITLDILTTSMRRDMLDYYKADSVRNIMNTMEGFSHLNPPVTDDRLQVQLTPVTLYTIQMLPAKKGKIVMTIYTVGDSLQAADSELRFYDENLQELKRDHYIKIAEVADFLDLKGLSRKEKDRILNLIPFPTVEYRVSEQGDSLEARLTVGKFLSLEANEILKPYLHRERHYRWNGEKWKMLKEPDLPD